MSDLQAYLPLTETLAPDNAAAASGMVAHASTVRTPVYPLGGGTRLGLGVRPTRPGYGLSLAKLNRVVDYAEQDLTITVEAGLTFAELARQLDARGQRLPVDAPDPERATIGGAVAADSFGPRSYGCGTLRDYVLGIQAIDGCGTLFSGGGRVVKNAAGYDMCRLLAGSLGSLGLITQVTLMVRPRPLAAALVACGLPDARAAERLLAGLVQSQTLPVAVELLGGPLWENDPALSAPLGEPFGCLAVGFEGNRPEVEWMVGQLIEEWGPAGAAALVVRDEQVGPIWQRATDFPPGGDELLTLEITALASAATEVIEAVRKAAPRASLALHAGSGLLCAALPDVAAADVPKFLDAHVRPALDALGARVVIRSAPVAAELDARDVWGPADASAELWSRLRAQFDPQGILNPGRML